MKAKKLLQKKTEKMETPVTESSSVPVQQAVDVEMTPAEKPQFVALKPSDMTVSTYVLPLIPKNASK